MYITSKKTSGVGRPYLERTITMSPHVAENGFFGRESRCVEVYTSNH